ncbi:N-acetyltransferase [Nonomuraea longispora]|uniref:N-acetyltransferase n=1 Tax=Nonomuraea longispora TaxID=1848320 RepID=A0A4R4N7K1_9ACTN|nr:N-acetyltransferase [Nonomuraea longispora]
MERENALAFIARSSDEAVGYATATLHERSGDVLARPRSFVALEHLAVDPGVVRTRIGTALVEAARTAGKEAGCSGLANAAVKWCRVEQPALLDVPRLKCRVSVSRGVGRRHRTDPQRGLFHLHHDRASFHSCPFVGWIPSVSLPAPRPLTNSTSELSSDRSAELTNGFPATGGFPSGTAYALDTD